ncbi:putative cAMP-dependent protein kinase catalytic subunit [Ixodes scapularis]
MSRHYTGSQDFYPAGVYIIRQGTSGDTFFIISHGSVKVTKRIEGTNQEEEIRILNRGDYFGEQALLRRVGTEDKRTANVVSLDPGVECLALDRDSFIQLIGDLRELQDKHYDDRLQLRPPQRITSKALEVDSEVKPIQLDDLEVLATLGIGGFGRVELVQYVQDRSRTFALKCLTKKHIVETQQQEHVLSEKALMMSCRHPFICRMFKTFRDEKYVYMLMEACLGGEVWSLLRDRGSFDEGTSRFYTGCVLEALQYLHDKGIVYRDLKPENMVLDSVGYAKLVDFGFSKRVPAGQKTWTFCGTPEYVAPEVVLNKGHDRAVDFWAVGVLMFELLAGTPPFAADDPMKTYNVILKGIDMLDFPRNMSRNAVSLIKRLCRENPSERLGYQKGGIMDIKKHKWFQSFDWDGLQARTLQPPFEPQQHSAARGPTPAGSGLRMRENRSCAPSIKGQATKVLPNSQYELVYNFLGQHVKETLTVVATDYETYLVVYRCEDTAGSSSAPGLCLPHAVHVSVLSRHPLDDSTAPDIRKALHKICVPEDALANLEVSEGGGCEIDQESDPNTSEPTPPAALEVCVCT